VDHADHVALLRGGVREPGGTWADLGSGSGAFTLALADLLGQGATIHSLDRDASALRVQASEMGRRFPGATLVQHTADFRTALPLPKDLDGIVMANAFHFVDRAEQPRVLGALAEHVRPGGIVLVVEYDTDTGNAAVPNPFSAAAWPALAAAAGLVDPRLLHRVPSRWLGAIYAAEATRPGSTDASRSKSASSL
jgi:SAM-dependent methyltransferase